MSDQPDAAKLSLRLPVVVALVTGVCTSAITLTAGWYLLVGRVERVEGRLVDETRARIESVTRIEIAAERSSERVVVLSEKVGDLNTSVASSLAAMKVQQVEDGKKLDLLLGLATRKSP